MKTIIEKWTLSNGYSFNMKTYTIGETAYENQEVIMRMHDEYEITIITGGNGKRIIGNTIENFSQSDIFLLGPNVPHCIQVDEHHEINGITIHFLSTAFGSGFFEIQENEQIFNLLEDMRSGVTIKGPAPDELVDKLKSWGGLNAFDRMISFFELLQEIALMENRRLLSSRGFTKTTNRKDYILVNKTFKYIMSRFESHKIPLEEISSHVNMSPSTFCRFFKKHFQKTYTSFMNEVRIGHACKLLQETDRNVAQVAYDSGYQHLSHFNKQFKEIVGYSPRQYRQELN